VNHQEATSTGDSSTSNVLVMSQNVQGLKDEAKLETIIRIMRERKVYAYCVHETWLEGDFE
jgi:hypothetical protein